MALRLSTLGGLGCLFAISSCVTPVQFERAVGTGKYPPMPATAPIELARNVKDLPPPTTVLGSLRLRQTKTSSPQGKAEEDLLDAAGRYGCDAIAEVKEARVDSRGQVDPAGTDWQWMAQCVRTGKAEVMALATGTKPAISPAEREHERLLGEAESARKEAERAAAVATEKERLAQVALEAADKDRVRQAQAIAELEKKRKEAEEERRRREADAATRDQQRKTQEASERSQREERERAKREADAAEKAHKRQAAAEEKARKEAEYRARKDAEAAERARKEAEYKARKASELEARERRKRELADQSESANAAKRKAEEVAARTAEEQAKRAGEEQAKRDADDRAKRDAEEAARRSAEETAKREAEDARKAGEDRARREADEKARADAEERNRREAEAGSRKGKGKAAGTDWKAKMDQASRDGSEAAWVELLSSMPEGEDADRAFEELQKAARSHASAWLQTDTPAVAAEETDIASSVDPAQLRKDLTEADATTARFLAPAEVSVAWTLKNPTRQQVAVDFKFGSSRVWRVLDAGGQATGVWKGRCIPQSPPLRSKVGLVLQYRFGCDTSHAVPRLSLVRPVRRELSVDRHALDADVALETIARVWQAVPGSRATDLQMLLVGEAMRRRAEDLSSLQIRVVPDKVSPGEPSSVKVEIRNAGSREVTVVFDVGTGRDERLFVGRKAAAEMRLVVPAGVNPEAKLKGVLPKLRSPDWLVGDWSFQGVHMVILPSDKGLIAFAIEPGAGEDIQPRAWPVRMEITGSDANWEAELPGLFALALFADKTPASCESRCTLRLRARLVDQDQYVLGAGRVLIVDVDVGDRSGSFKLAADF